MAEEKPSPHGPWTDYGRPLGGAEEAVGAVIEQLLVDGGTMLWQKYLERKAFGFAASTATDAVVSNVSMCYVPCDAGEDCEDDWAIEEEPEPGVIDNWARMHLPVRRQVGGEGATPGASNARALRSIGAANRGMQTTRSRVAQDMRARSSTRSGKADKSESRSMPIQDDSALDEEEEQLREAKVQEEVRRREQARRALEIEKAEEDERRQVALRHEEMRSRPHTFDQDGNVIWVEEFKVERLPKVQELAGYHLGRDARARSMEETLRSTATGANKDEPTAASASGSKRRGTRNSNPNRGGKAPSDTEFTDGFSKLQHGQPPILETMVMQSGVTLEAMGRKKMGAADLIDRHVMSRKEYNRLAANESAVDFRAGSSAATVPIERRTAESPAPGGDGGVVSGQSGAAASSALGAAVDRDLPGLGGGPNGSVTFGAATAAFEGAGSGEAGGPPLGVAPSSLPPLKGSRNGSKTAAPASGGGGPNAPPPQRAPPAPPMATRHMGKKFEAMGYVAFQRLPRYHVPQLGGPQGHGVAQPPLGATMGHGLMRHGSHKEDFFFPPMIPEVPSGMNRSSSDASLVMGSGRRAARGLSSARANSSHGRSREGWSPGRHEEDAAGHGRLHAETTSAAYRNFRHMLAPEPPAQTAGGGGNSVGGGSNVGVRY